MSQGNLDSAASLLAESLQCLEQLGDRRGIAVSTLYLATLARYRKEYSTARSMAQESLSVAQRMGDRVTYGISLSELGMLDFLLGNLRDAAKMRKGTPAGLFQTNK